MNTTITVNHARRHLGEIIEEVHYLDKPFTLTRRDKPMATLISTKLFDQMIKLIEKYDHGLTDTLAISVNPEIQAILDQGEQDIQDGKVLPFDENLLNS